MKKLLCLLLVLNLILIGCSAKETVKSEEGKNDIAKEIKEEQNKDNEEVSNKDEEKTDNEAKEVNQPAVDEKLKDFESIKEYLMNDDYFGMGYYEAEGDWFNDDNYILHHIDFTGDDKLDTIIVTYTDEEDFRTVVFVTLENGKYKHYYTDFRATKDSVFYYEDGFIVQERNGYHELAFLTSFGEANYIKRTFGGFNNETIESDYRLNPDMKEKSINTVNKIDGYKEFETDYINYFYDETGKEHLISHIKYHYNFNEDNAEHESTEEIVVDNNLTEIMSDNFIVGNDKSLKTFEQVIDGSDNLKTAIDYYVENRKKFEQNSRIKYIDDVLRYVNGISSYEIYVDEEIVLDESITKITLWGENPIPTNAQDLFKIVRYFYIDDGENMNMNYIMQLEDNDYNGDYNITCVDDGYSNKIRMLKFDRAVLSEEDAGYISRDDQYADIVFDTKENVYEKADEIVYPTILIKNLSQLNDLKHKSIWKTNVVIIPEEIEFLEYTDEDI